MRKILLLISCIFIITGCKVEYNLVINNDLTVEETVNMTGTDDFFEGYYKSSRISVVKMLFNDGRQKQLTENGYKYEIVENATPYVVATKKYNNISEFSENTIFYKQYFEKINVNENDGIVEIHTQGFIPISADLIEQYGIKTSSISIKLPYNVLENNAKIYEPQTNTYTWYISDETTDFSLNLVYDRNELYSPPVNEVDWLMILVTLVFIVASIVIYIINKKNIKH